MRTGCDVASRAEPTVPVAVANASMAQPVVVKVAHDEVREPFVEIYARAMKASGSSLRSRCLSLSNKTPGEQGRDLYKRKQKEFLASQVHLIEFDFLRGGEHTTAVPLDLARGTCGPFDYHISVRRFDDLETFLVYPICLENRLPAVDVPLLPGDSSVTLDLQSVFDRCYDAGPTARDPLRRGCPDPSTPTRPGRLGRDDRGRGTGLSDAIGSSQYGQSNNFPRCWTPRDVVAYHPSGSEDGRNDAVRDRCARIFLPAPGFGLRGPIPLRSPFALNFGPDAIFMDIDAIPFGVNFRSTSRRRSTSAASCWP